MTGSVLRAELANHSSLSVGTFSASPEHALAPPARNHLLEERFAQRPALRPGRSARNTMPTARSSRRSGSLEGRSALALTRQERRAAFAAGCRRPSPVLALASRRPAPPGAPG